MLYFPTRKSHCWEGSTNCICRTKLLLSCSPVLWRASQCNPNTSSPLKIIAPLKSLKSLVSGGLTTSVQHQQGHALDVCLARDRHFQGMSISPSPRICSSLLPASRLEGCSLGSRTALHDQLEDDLSQLPDTGVSPSGSQHCTSHSLPHLPAPVLAFNGFSLTNIPVHIPLDFSPGLRCSTKEFGFLSPFLHLSEPWSPVILEAWPSIHCYLGDGRGMDPHCTWNKRCDSLPTDG